MKSKLAWRREWSLEGMGILPSTQKSVTLGRQEWLKSLPGWKIPSIKAEGEVCAIGTEEFSIEAHILP